MEGSIEADGRNREGAVQARAGGREQNGRKWKREKEKGGESGEGEGKGKGKGGRHLALFQCRLRARSCRHSFRQRHPAHLSAHGHG